MSVQFARDVRKHIQRQPQHSAVSTTYRTSTVILENMGVTREKNKLTSGVPRITDPETVKPRGATTAGVMGLTSTYIKAALHRVPKTSDMAPWADRKGYLNDLWDAAQALMINDLLGPQITRSLALEPRDWLDPIRKVCQSVDFCKSEDFSGQGIMVIAISIQMISGIQIKLISI